MNCHPATNTLTSLQSVLICVPILLCVFLNSEAVAQLNTVPKTVTLKNGAQLEGEVFSVPSVGGFELFPSDVKPIVAVDDGLRLVFFNRNRIAKVGDAVVMQNELTIPVFQNKYLGDTSGFGHVVSIGPFDLNGHRLLTVRTTKGTTTFVQGITEIGPRHCEVQTLNIPKAIPGDNRRMRDWTMRVGTSSIPLDVLRNVLRMRITDDESASQQLQIVEFFVQSQQFNRALEELRLMQAKPQFQKIRDELESRRNSVRQSYARWWLREIRSRMDSGQFDYAMQLAVAFDKEGIAGETLAEFMDLQRQMEATDRRVETTRQSISAFVAETISSGVLEENQVEVIRRFANELETELNQSNLDRLDSYLRFADDAATKVDRKIALALSGWLLGANDAIDNLAVAESLYPVRDVVEKYLKLKREDRQERVSLLNELESYEGGAPQYLDSLIENMKPPLSPNLETYNGKKPIEFFVEVPGTAANTAKRNFQCLAHLPPQYDPYRKYPCIITLRAGIKTETQLNRWVGRFNEKLQVRTGPAMRNGYIVVAVDWKQEGQSAYTYSAREHAVVLGALKSSLKMFAVDSDRVFLHGNDIGASAAFDIGIAHPEHWAGIVGVGGVIEKYPFHYRQNKHVKLPIYCVTGRKDKASRDKNQKSWNQWCQTDRYLDCVVVIYKGRANVSYSGGPTAETFSEEIPNIFKWMTAQRRIRPSAAGFEFECRILRPWDNYFWFWQLHDVPEKNVTRPEHWTFSGHKPLTISGELKNTVPNRFILGPKNLGSGGTLWLSPEFVDFNKEVTISGRGDFSEFVKPSRSVLLEDVRVRGDRQHPYWAKVECRGKRWGGEK